jgi:hypothetical protein
MRADGSDNRPIGENVVARLRALRDEHPDAQITTELVRLDDGLAVVRAEISLPSGGSASGYGASSASGHEAVEEAETRALSRSLTVLGYGAGPVQPAVAALPAEQTRDEPAQERAAEPVELPVAATGAVPEQRPTATSSKTTDREPAPALPVTPAAPPERAQPASAADGDGEPPLEDYSWTAFWNWARKLGYQNKTAVEELIGQSITSLSPAQVRNLLREKTGVE